MPRRPPGREAPPRTCSPSRRIRKTGYKIFNRYKDCGLDGLTDRRDLRRLEGAEAEPRASIVARWAVEALTRGEAVAVADLLPRYLRRAEAEAKRTGEAFEPRGGRA